MKLKSKILLGVVVLVVAADDGIMPQTAEVIELLKINTK